MKKFFILSGVIFCLACGKDDSFKRKSAGEAGPNAESFQLEQTVDNASVNQQPKKNKKQKLKKVELPTPSIAPLQSSQSYQDLAKIPQPLPQVELVTEVATSPVVESAPVHIVGVARVGEKPEDAGERGFNYLIANARFCAITQKFTDGSRCYFILSNGHTIMATFEIVPLVDAYIKNLKDQKSVLDAQKKAKKKKK